MRDGSGGNQTCDVGHREGWNLEGLRTMKVERVLRISVRSRRVIIEIYIFFINFDSGFRNMRMYDFTRSHCE